MQDSNQRQATLLRLYLDGNATPSQMEELFALLKNDPQPQLIEDEMRQTFSFSGHQSEYLDAGITERINAKIRAQLPSAPVVQRIHFLKTAWFRYAAAIILLCGVGAYLWTHTFSSQKPVIDSTQQVITQNDVLPGSNKAVLTLSNGSSIVLDGKDFSQRIEDGSVSIKNSNGELSYDKHGIVVQNIMSTPRGGQYKLVLPDGSAVWLNAASSISYPTAFTGKERRVEITGEVYFEVAKNAAKPFIVKTFKDEITVLGTFFNVNAYADEPVMKTTLIEGSIKAGSSILKPGQASINGEIIKTNIERDISWKNGYFSFENADIKTVMRQIARWYNIYIKYENSNSGANTFSGVIRRDINLSELVEGLKASGIDCEIKEDTLIVKLL